MPLGMLLTDAFDPLPVFIAAALVLVGMRLQGVLTDELIAELYSPFSRSTLMLVGGLVLLCQLAWLLANLVG